MPLPERKVVTTIDIIEAINTSTELDGSLAKKIDPTKLDLSQLASAATIGGESGTVIVNTDGGGALVGISSFEVRGCTVVTIGTDYIVTFTVPYPDTGYFFWATGVLADGTTVLMRVGTKTTNSKLAGSIMVYHELGLREFQFGCVGRKA